MGQAQSQAATAENAAEAATTGEPPSRGGLSSPSTSDANNNPLQQSIDSLIAEAAALSLEDKNESLEAKAQKALECPCIAHLRTGPCGLQFSDAFLCFLMSTAEEKGSDCVKQFVAFQECIKTNPDAFTKDVLDEDKEEEKPAQEYKIIPPLWSEESKKSKKSKA